MDNAAHALEFVINFVTHMQLQQSTHKTHAKLINESQNEPSTYQVLTSKQICPELLAE